MADPSATLQPNQSPLIEVSGWSAEPGARSDDGDATPHGIGDSAIVNENSNEDDEDKALKKTVRFEDQAEGSQANMEQGNSVIQEDPAESEGGKDDEFNDVNEREDYFNADMDGNTENNNDDIQ